MKKRIEVSHAALFEHMAKTIASHERVVLAVARTRREPAFQYTVGNQEKGLPELLLIGNYSQEAGGALLNQLSAQMKERRAAFADGEQITLGGEHPMLIHTAGPEAKSQWTIQAGQFYCSEDYQVQQVLLPDENGRYPGDPLCHKDYRVPVLKAQEV